MPDRVPPNDKQALSNPDRLSPEMAEPRARPTLLIARERELGLIEQVLESLPHAGGGLLLWGAAGVGKTALLTAAAEGARARGYLVLRASGSQFERDLPFAGLHQLLHPIVDRIDGLAVPQRDALRVALGLATERQPDLFHIGLAALNLLGDVAATTPMVLVVDDCHWLDSSTVEVLAFVGRRLHADAIGIVGAARDIGDMPLAASGLAEVEVRSLDDQAAAELLLSRAPDLPQALRARILVEAAGNPLALVELPSAIVQSPGETLREPLALTTRLERSFAARHDKLPESTRALLLVASLDEVVTLGEAIGAASLLVGSDVMLQDLEPAVDERLVRVVDTRLTFPHPLVRNAIHQATTVTALRDAHLALVRVLSYSPERQVWHRAAAALGPDEEVATALDGMASDAVRRGAPGEAASALARAAVLSVDPQARAGRMLRAGEHGVRVGRRGFVASVLEDAARLDLSPLDQARLALIREAFEPGVDGEPSVILALVSHARSAATADHPDLALELLIAAASNAFWAAHTDETREAIREAAASLGVASRDPRQLAIEAFIAPAEDIDDVVTLLRPWQGIQDLSADGLLLLGSAAFAACDHELSVGFLSASVDGLRAEGRLERLAQALVMRAWSGIHVGRWDLAAPDAQEAYLLSEETAQPIWGAGATAALAWLAAVRGQEDDASELVMAAEHVALPARSRAVCSLTTLSRGMLALARGESEVAYQHLRRMLDPTDLAHHQMTSAWGIAGLADAAMAIGSAPEAGELIADLAERGERRGSGVHRRMVAHARAVLASDAEAGGLFVAALEQVREPAFDRARLQLAHGSWLRRHRRIVEARDALRAARETFDATGAVPWGERAREELRASGESSMVRRPGVLDDLSPQELQVAQMAGAGLTNREIGERLYLSHRTVASHLYRVFPKLNVTSRAQLRDALTAGGS